MSCHKESTVNQGTATSCFEDVRKVFENKHYSRQVRTYPSQDCRKAGDIKETPTTTKAFLVDEFCSVSHGMAAHHATVSKDTYTRAVKFGIGKEVHEVRAEQYFSR